MRIQARFFILTVGTVLMATCGKREVTFAPPPPAEIARLFAFDKPVSLGLQTASAESLQHAGSREIQPLAMYSYSNELLTTHSFGVGVYPAGSFVVNGRCDLLEQFKANPPTGQLPGSQFGVSTAKDGRPIYQFPFGPRGSILTLIPSRNGVHELMVSQSVTFHGNDVGKALADLAVPTREPKDVIEEIERLVLK